MLTESVGWRRHTRLIVAISLGIISCLPNLNSVAGPWLLDDVPLIARNPLVLSPERWPMLLTTDYWISRGAPAGIYRPVPMLSFALNNALFGARPLPFHITNLLFNAMVCIGLWVILMRRSLRPIGLFAAVAFALHPAHAEAVANIIGRSELLVAFWFLAAWYLHTRASAGASPWLRVPESLCWLLMALSKENGAPLLALPLVAWWIAPRRTARGLMVRLSPAIVAGATYLAMRVVFGIGMPELPRDYTIGERFALITSATAKTAQLLSGFFTHRAVYPVPHHLPPWMIVAGSVCFAVLIAIPIALLRRKSSVAIPATGFMLSLVTLLQIYPNTVWVWERGLYVPTLMLAWGIAEYARNVGAPAKPAAAKVIACFAAGALLLIFAWRTTRVSSLYANEQRFWSHEYRQNPNHLPTMISYSENLARSNMPGAIGIRQDAVARHPKSGFAYSSLASLYLKSGDASAARDTLTTAAQQNLEFASSTQHRQGYRALAALAHQAQMPDIAQQFLATARRNPETLP